MFTQALVDMDEDLDKGLAHALEKGEHDIIKVPNEFVSATFKDYFITWCKEKINQWIGVDWQQAKQIAELEFVHKYDDGEWEWEDNKCVGTWFGYTNARDVKKYGVHVSNHCCSLAKTCMHFESLPHFQRMTMLLCSSGR